LWLAAGAGPLQAGELVPPIPALDGLQEAIRTRIGEVESCPDGAEGCLDARREKQVLKLLVKADLVLASARERFAGGERVAGVLGSAAAARLIEKAAPDAGLLVVQRLDGLTASSLDLGDEAREDLEEALADLCEAFRARLAKNQANADEALASAELAAESDDFDASLKSLGKALKLYEGLLRSAERLLPRPCPPPRGNCPSSGFTPAPEGAPCLDIAPVAPGSRLCYDVVVSILGVEADGNVCYNFESPSSMAVDGHLDILGADVDLFGTLTVKACNDANGFARVSSMSQNLTFNSVETGRVRAKASLKAKPATLTLLGSLLPVPPSALKLCEGDTVVETDVVVSGSVSGFGGSRSSYEATHEVVAIADVTVPAGTFRAAQIRSVVSGEEVIDGELVQSDFTIDTWIAPEVGQVKVEVTGSATIRMTLEEATLP
jgi:hypothetical protein